MPVLQISDIDDGIDVIVKRVYSTLISANQQGTAENPSKLSQTSVAPSNSTVTPVVSTSEATAFYHELQLPEYPGPDDPLVHALAGWEAPGAHYRSVCKCLWTCWVLLFRPFIGCSLNLLHALDSLLVHAFKKFLC